MISHSLNNKGLVVDGSGKVDANDLMKHYNLLLNDPSLPPELSVLLNMSEASFDIEIADIRDASKLMTELSKKYDLLKEAMLVDEPSMTATAMIFKATYNEFENYRFKVFSTREAALNWLYS